MREKQNGRPRESIGPGDWLKVVPTRPAATSIGLGWVGVEAARYCAAHASELEQHSLTHHWLVLFARPPEELELRYDGVKRQGSPAAGAISVVPAGMPSRWRCSGRRDLLNVHLEPAIVARVAEQSFELDPARLAIPPLDALELPHLRAAMGAVANEMTTGGAGGPLAAESLANVIAVQLIRHAMTPGRSPAEPRGADGPLPRNKLRAVVEYIEAHLHVNLTLRQMAAIAHLSPYHFARQFKAATGLPPHQYVIARRVERAQRLLLPRKRDDIPLFEVATRAGFSDQSQFSNHFKRLVGVTPRQFRAAASGAAAPLASAAAAAAAATARIA